MVPRRTPLPGPERQRLPYSFIEALESPVSDSSQIPTAAHLAAAHPELVARGSADSAVAHGSRPQIDAVSTITEYLDRSDWRVNANANQGYSLGGMILNLPKIGRASCRERV